MEVKSNEEFYNSKLDLGLGENIKTVGWENEETAEARYKIVAQMIPKDCKSVADLGCGLGLFTKYLPEHIELYRGYDIHSPFVQKAICDAVADIDNGFVVGDVEDVRKVDCIVSIGAFTLRFDWKTDEDYETYFNQKLVTMVERVNNCVVINAFSNAVDFKDPKLYYHSIDNLFKKAKELNCMLSVQNYVSPYEFVARFTKIKENNSK